MAVKNKHSTEYKKYLLERKDDFQLYLKNRTGYYIKLDIVEDKQLGFVFAVKISLDATFNQYSRWVLAGNTKAQLREELLEKVVNLDWRNKIRGGSTVKKVVRSSAKQLECVCCNEIKNISQYHRNIHSDLYKSRGGHCSICRDCINNQFMKLFCAKGVYDALRWTCSIYDRNFCRELVDFLLPQIKAPVELASLYFKRLNNPKFKKRLLYINSDT